MTKLNRTVNTRYLKPDILIVCEGEKTEPNYFIAFPITTKRVKVVGVGMNTLSLVEKAIELNKDEKERSGSKKGYDKIWCVFDRDSHNANNIHSAVSLAKKHKIEIAYSNEAFELWYILHFDYLDAAISRTQYKTMLTTNMGTTYQKNSPDMYKTLLPRQKTARDNARRLYNTHPQFHYINSAPCTTVFMLVEELNKYLPGSK